MHDKSHGTRVLVASLVLALLALTLAATTRARSLPAQRVGAAPGVISGRVHAKADASSPSGAAMPTTNPAGWREVFSDDFLGNRLNTDLWKAYSGVPGGDPSGAWSPSHVVVRNGMLILRNYVDHGHETNAGVSSQPGLVQTYGKYLVRYRIANGEGVSHVLLLWPAGRSPGREVDFSEDNGGTRRLRTYSFMHYGTGVNDQITGSTAVNLNRWHTLGVEWTFGKIVYTVDGKAWKTVRSSGVPNISMVLDLQTQSWCGHGVKPRNSWEHCLDSRTPREVDMDVDWVVAYAPAH